MEHNAAAPKTMQWVACQEQCLGEAPGAMWPALADVPRRDPPSFVRPLIMVLIMSSNSPFLVMFPLSSALVYFSGPLFLALLDCLSSFLLVAPTCEWGNKPGRGRAATNPRGARHSRHPSSFTQLC